MATKTAIKPVKDAKTDAKQEKDTGEILIASPVRINRSTWGVKLQGRYHTMADEGMIAKVITRYGKTWDVWLDEKVFEKEDGGYSHWRATNVADMPQDKDAPKPDVFQGTPARLSNRSWGVKIVTAHPVEKGDQVVVTTKSRDTWITTVVDRVGECLYTTTGRVNE